MAELNRGLSLARSCGADGLFGLDVLYQGEQYLDTDLDPASYQAATTKLNARVGVSPANRRWSAAATPGKTATNYPATNRKNIRAVAPPSWP